MGRFSSIAKSVKATNSFKRSSKADSAASSAADVESNRLEETVVEPAHPAPRLGADVAPLRSLTDRALGSAGHPDARLDLADLFRRRLDERWRRAEQCRIIVQYSTSLQGKESGTYNVLQYRMICYEII